MPVIDTCAFNSVRGDVQSNIVQETTATITLEPCTCDTYMGNGVGEAFLCSAQDAWLRVVVALPGQLAQGAVAKPHVDHRHAVGHVVIVALLYGWMMKRASAQQTARIEQQ